MKAYTQWNIWEKNAFHSTESSIHDFHLFNSVIMRFRHLPLQETFMIRD